MRKVVEIESLHKSFTADSKALNGIDLDVMNGEMVALIGPSGSGKSTLLRHIAGLTCGDKKRSGKISVLGNSIQVSGKLAPDIRASRSNIGYIFQQFNLINRASVLSNVLTGFLGGISRMRGSLGLFTATERTEAMQALERVGMAQHAWKRADALSGGQQQRVAIARTLVQKADIILADEPIASLDPESSRKVMNILKDIHETDNKTIIVTLHQVDYARSFCDRAVALKRGSLYFDGPCSDLNDELLSRIYGEALETYSGPATSITPSITSAHVKPSYQASVSKSRSDALSNASV